MKFYVFIFCLGFSNLFHSQINTDYAFYQKQHQTIGCNIVDSVIFVTVLNELLALDTTQFDKNLDLFHRDLSQAYACTWIYSKNPADLRNAVMQLKLIKNQSYLDHYNNAFYLTELKECEQALTHLDLYLKKTPTKELLPSEEIENLRKRCLNWNITDYKEYRKTQTKLTCTPQDSSTIVNKLYDLLLLDTTQFTVNLDWYYQDLGWAYYKCFLEFKDSSLLLRSINAYLKQNELHSTDYWNIMFSYYILHDCENGEKYLDLYKMNTKRKYYKDKKEEITRIKKKCNF